ncbi:MAG TPA: hypothetical protein VF516_44600, partial [Kofleriaceae bacterium]
MTIAPDRQRVAGVSAEADELTICADPYDPRCNSDNFDFEAWLAGHDPDLFATAEGRRAATRADPMLFALTYLRHHLTDKDTGEISFADCHLDWYRYARQWMIKDTGLRGWRHSFASPRNSAKSTTWYTLVPIWAGAHGHVKFLASFADSGTQAEMHLQTFRTEAQHNRLLRNDFPDLCTAIRKPTGRTVADNEGQYQSKSGFVWVARGIDTSTLGMKVGDRRPDVIILDDIEKDESNYSPLEVEKRRKTLIDAILPLNERAKVVLVGTVTRPGSINHQLVKVALSEVDPASEEGEALSWIGDERIKPHYYAPILERSDGSRRSIWPAKWSLEYLESIEHTRNYAKNFANNPRAESGPFWSGADIRYSRPVNVARQYLFVDPPTTTKTTSDPAGLAVLGYAPGTGKLPSLEDRKRLKHLLGDDWRDTLTREEAEAQGLARLARVVVEHAEEVRATGTPLKLRVLTLLERFPGIVAVVIEVNQGGDLWKEIMDELPVKLITFHSSEPKIVRIGWGLEMYQKRRVTHAKRLPAAE